MPGFSYPKSSAYTDLDTIYAQCSSPGGLQLAEFMAEIESGKKLLDVGCNRGYQTCFLAKKYGVLAIGINIGRLSSPNRSTVPIPQPLWKCSASRKALKATRNACKKSTTS